jgi:hypothetical protein
MRIDSKVLRDLTLAPLDVREGEDEIPDDIHRIFKRDVGGVPVLDLFVRAGESERADSGAVLTDFIASTASIDRMGDSVEQSWRLAAWRKNPVILYEHAAPVVGKGVARVPKESGNLTIKVQWDIGEHNPIGTLAGMQHLNGFRSAGSVGFIPGKVENRLDLPDDDPRKAPKGTPRYMAGHVFKFNELLEFSSVAVPANREAVQLGMLIEEIEDPDEKIQRAVKETIDRSTAAMILDAVKADPEIRSAILSLAWGSAPVPEPPKKAADPNDIHRLFNPSA